MAGHQCHLVEIGHVPRRDEQTTRVGIAFDLVDDLGDLIDVAAIRGRPGAPLIAVHRTELSIFIGPFVPDAYAVFLEIAGIGFAPQEPQQFVDDRLQVNFLRRQQRKACLQIETQLRAEDTQRPRPGAVVLAVSVLEDMPHQVKVLAHRYGRHSNRE
jgi:hypothetical protein